MSVYDDWAAFVDVRRRRHRRHRRRSTRPTSAARSRRRGRCSPSGSTTAATPRSRAWQCPRCPRRSPSSRRRSAGPFDDIEIVGDTVDWEVELVAVIGAQRRPRRRGRRLGPRRRADRRPGHQRPHAAVRRRRAVLARQVAARLRPDGAVGRHARRGAEPRRPRARLLGRRRDRAGRPHQRPHLLACRSLVAELSAVLPLLPGDVIFTGTPAGVGVDPPAAAVPAAGPGARDVDRGHRHDPEPLRVTSHVEIVRTGTDVPHPRPGTAGYFPSWGVSPSTCISKYSFFAHGPTAPSTTSRTASSDSPSQMQMPNV